MKTLPLRRWWGTMFACRQAARSHTSRVRPLSHKLLGEVLYPLVIGVPNLMLSGFGVVFAHQPTRF